MLQIKIEYVSPHADVIEINAEGVLCESGTEGLNEKQGVW